MIQHIMATTFWSPEGKPMSAREFIEKLYGELPLLFENEDELRALWSRPDTRKKLLEGLAEKGFGDRTTRPRLNDQRNLCRLPGAPLCPGRGLTLIPPRRPAAGYEHRTAAVAGSEFST